jgi:hypothetical protein
MQQGLQRFAKRTKSNDGQNAPNSQLSNVGRRANAASLKMPTKKTVLSHDDHVEQLPVRSQSGGQNHAPIAQLQHRRQGEGHGTHQKNDIYDTDAESLDTTINQRSTAQVKDSQDTQQHGQVLSGGDEEFDMDESDEVEEGEDGDGEGETGSADYQEQGYEPEELAQQYLEDVGVDLAFIPNYVPQQRGLFDGNNSYPSTTSGPPSNFPHNYHPNKEPSLDHYDQQSVFLSPKPIVKGQLHRQPSQPLPQHTVPAPESKQMMHNHPHVFHRAAELRGIQNTVPNIANRGAAPKQSHPPPLLTSQPPLHNQSISQVVQSPLVNETTHQNDVTHADQPPRRGTRPPTGPTRLKPERPAQQPLPVTRTAPLQQVDEVYTHRHAVENGTIYRQTVGEDFDHRQSIEEAPLQQGFAQEVYADDQEHVEDYDRSDLFKMDYDQLRSEDFDHIPRAVNSVLSEDMLQKPLADRLQHVRSSLNREDQSKFFGSLSAVEWEESGDWFLDQFSGIIDRAKKARQAKRKLAAGFEAEIERRHEHVSKKQRQVHEAMSTMKVQGQVLIPKSPMRGSKSPSRRSKTPLRQK